MKKYYESPESLIVAIQMGKQVLVTASPGDDDEPAGTREQKDNWNDDWDDTDN